MQSLSEPRQRAGHTALFSLLELILANGRHRTTTKRDHKHITQVACGIAYI